MRAKVLPSDQADANDGVSVLFFDFKRSGQEALDYVGVGAKVQEHAAGDYALDQGQHLHWMIARYYPQR
jgi:hypothetical protein